MKYIAILLLSVMAGCSHARSVESYLENPPIAIAQTDPQGQGRTYTREVTATRILSPVGVSPGETLSRMEPAKITATGFTGGGGKWGWLDSLWATVKSWLWGIGLVLLAVLLLPIFVPALGPVIGAVFRGVGRFITWIVPVLGGVIEAAKRATMRKTAVELVTSQEAFKARLAACEALEEEEKALVLTLLKQANKDSQGDKCENFVDRETEGE